MTNIMSEKIYVDLDGTLINTDSLWESVLLLLKCKPIYLLFLPWWLCRGRAYFKHAIAQHVVPNPTILPYHQELLIYLKQQKAAGKQLILATAANIKIAQAIAEYLGIFDSVLASTDKQNLKSLAKLQAIQQHSQMQNFCYVGNDKADEIVWQQATEIIQVNVKSNIRRRWRDQCDHYFERTHSYWLAWLKALRIHQWVKNILLFVPLVAAHQFRNIELLQATVVGFFAFSFIASSIYIVNDLLDLEADRHHHHKKNRAFAAGMLSVKWGVVAVFPLMLASVILTSLLPSAFAMTLIVYFVMTLSYSFYLKRCMLVDVIVLAGLYMLRILAGAMATNIVVSNWLLAFSMFLFLSLALAKRYIELKTITQEKVLTARGYQKSDSKMLAMAGFASSYVSVMVIALYINSEIMLHVYHHPVWLWALCPLMLFWSNRIWLLAERGIIDTDPLVFSIKDKVTYGVAFAMLCVLLLAR
ncbi:MAG: UbiA family prenyltransferase [Gammaproteobacteria bacterium]